jgi:cbb3-type cytochrome oxidase maturation protein
MNALFVLIIISILIAIGFLAAFIWAVRNGQMDDDYTPSIRMLWDNELTAKKSKKTNS